MPRLSKAKSLVLSVTSLATALALLSALLMLGLESHPAKSSQVRGNSLPIRGINLGAALEAPREGEWGVTLKSEYFQAIADAGFQSVRVPIRWSAHSLRQSPYTISPEFFARVDWVVREALSRNLSIVLNMHHYVDVYKDPDGQLPHLLALWDQIAARYRSFSPKLSFELLNEPYDQLTDERWQSMFPELLRRVRQSNPERTIIIGPGFWNSVDHLDQLHLPDDDDNLIATFHYYVPMRFTHQGASWVRGADQWKNVAWTGSPDDRKTLQSDFEKAAEWSRRNRRAIYVGEFGALQTADMDSRARWTEAVAREAEKHGFSWSYWEFCSSFGAYDLKAAAWREPLLRALIPQ
jgi:endoglucanase